MLSDEEGAGSGLKEHFSLSSIMKAERDVTKRRKKRKNQSEEGVPASSEFRVNVDDPRFKALYESHLYAPDPSAPQYRWVWFDDITVVGVAMTMSL